MMIPKEFPYLVIDWFQKHGRILPWREGRDPYRIWISEIMLQQTRIEAVIPYYHRFLEKLPTISDLADCPEDFLLKLWEGLGYYSRARNLKKAAEKIMADFGGKLPEEVKDLKSLSGIGDYTAGAIASIAFGKPAPAVDGNVLRVLTRVLCDKSDIALPETKKKLTAQLEKIYPVGKEAGDLTEGIMEIGERICIPNGAPLCTVCPLKNICLAKKESLTDSIPVKSPKKERKILPMTVFVLAYEDRFALRKRPSKGLLAGMWEFFHCDEALDKTKAENYLKKNGIGVKSLKSLGKSKHIFTHLEWHMTGYLVPCEKEMEGFEWVTKEQMDKDYALPTAFLKFKEKLK
ncbi:MAG: A/G-specific adenine glycosylase [Clostridia bacterium]|nr:A/G-specific adenine glycosylase [Clostridia bacterium]